MYAGDKPQVVLNFANERQQLLLLVVGKLRNDRDQVASTAIESKILVLQIAQALAEHRRRTQ